MFDLYRIRFDKALSHYDNGIVTFEDARPFKLTGSVHNGGDAMTIFPKIKDMMPDEQQKAHQSLLDYCRLDTLAMVRIWQKLEEISR